MEILEKLLREEAEENEWERRESKLKRLGFLSGDIVIDRGNHKTIHATADLLLFGLQQVQPTPAASRTKAHPLQ